MSSWRWDKSQDAGYMSADRIFIRNVLQVRERPYMSCSFLGRYMGVNVRWGHHEVVVRDGRVFDAFGPAEGVSISDFKNKFQYPDGLDFGF